MFQRSSRSYDIAAYNIGKIYDYFKFWFQKSKFWVLDIINGQRKITLGEHNPVVHITLVSNQSTIRYIAIYKFELDDKNLRFKYSMTYPHPFLHCQYP